MYPEILLTDYTYSSEKEGYTNHIIGNKRLIVAHALNNKYYFGRKNNYIIFAHVNYGVLKLLAKEEYEINEIISWDGILRSQMVWGVVILYNIKTKEFLIVNDYFGIYPLYLYHDQEKIVVSNNFDKIVRDFSKGTVNKLAIYDYLIFNYTLKDRTLFTDVKKVEGFSEIIIKDDIKIHNRSLSDLININNKYDNSIYSIIDNLQKFIHEEIQPSMRNHLALTGGFDSKLVLSLLLSSELSFRTFTFGPAGSDDSLSASNTAKMFDLVHTQIEMTTDFVNNIDSGVKRLIKYNPNCPMIDSLINYLIVNDSLLPSNIIAGVMGGELIVGPVIVSELITTRYAALLTQSDNPREFASLMMKELPQIPLFNADYVKNDLNQYSNSLFMYTGEYQLANNFQVVEYLLKETYAKFFGTVFNILFGKHNLIFPFINIQLLNFLYNSKFSFLNRKPFKKAPIHHFASRRFYSKIVQQVYPLVLTTPMDRGYKMRDFLYTFRILSPALNYAKRHYLNSRNKNYKKDYMSQLLKLAQEILPNSKVLDYDFLQRDEILNILNNIKDVAPNYQIDQKIVQLLTIHLIIDEYNNEK